MPLFRPLIVGYYPLPGYFLRPPLTCATPCHLHFSFVASGTASDITIDPCEETTQVIRHEEAIVRFRVFHLWKKQEAITGRKWHHLQMMSKFSYRTEHNSWPVSVQACIFIYLRVMKGFWKVVVRFERKLTKKIAYYAPWQVDFKLGHFIRSLYQVTY